MASKNQSTPTDADAWARRTAARLRLIHASFADQGFDQKRAYLEDEIGFALEDSGALSGEQQKDLLDCLANCFPICNEPVSQVFDSPLPQEVPSKAGDPVESLIAAWQGADDSQKARISQSLVAAGIIHAGASSAPLPEELAVRVDFPVRPEELEDFVRGIDQLWKELGLPGGSSGKATDFNRLFKLLGMLCASTRDLHKFLWEFWRQTATRELQSACASGFSETFEQKVAAYLCGDEGVTSRDLAVEIEKTKRLMLGVCVGVRKGAEEFARSQHQVFAPENIENAVVIEETATDASKVRDLGRKAWSKYCQLSKHMTPDSIDQEFHRVFAGVMTSWLRSRG